MRAPSFALFALLSSAALELSACSLDTAVFVQPGIDDPAVKVNSGVLGLTLEGSFSLRLHLGPRASGPSEVSLGALSLASANDKAPIVSPLAVKTAALPITVNPGRDVTTSFTLDPAGKPLPFDAKTKLCDAAGLVILSTLDDSLASAPTPVSSASFQPTGCP